MSERQLTPTIFQISTGTSEPIYRQLIEQIRRQIAAGQICPADTLPSVRDVAANLGVNPMTISKAYSLLESEGILERHRGLGMRVAMGVIPINDQQQRLELIRPSLMKLLEEAKQLELEADQVIFFLSELFSQSKRSSNE